MILLSVELFDEKRVFSAGHDFCQIFVLFCFVLLLILAHGFTIAMNQSAGLIIAVSLEALFGNGNSRCKTIELKNGEWTKQGWFVILSKENGQTPTMKVVGYCPDNGVIDAYK